jgi:hypothetical protein
MKKIIYPTIISILILANYSPVNLLLKENYAYTNIDGSFTFSEECGKGFDYESAIRSYAIFLCMHPAKDQGDNRLFRTFRFKPWYFWEWHDMVFDSGRFWLPYLSVKYTTLK